MTKVKVYCGCYVWPFSLMEEPDECYWEGEVEIDDYEWRDGYACVKCPSCGAELNQSDNHMELAT